MLDQVIIKRLEIHQDDRGNLIECWREDDLDIGEFPARMMYVSWTFPGGKRGPHLHKKQTDLFTFQGPGLFEVYLWEVNKPEHRLLINTGTVEPATILVPPGIVHAYKNISKINGLVINCPNKLYKGWDRNEPEDIIRFEDDPNNPYVF